MTLGMVKLGIMTLGMITLGVTALSIMTLKIQNKMKHRINIIGIIILFIAMLHILTLNT